MLTMTTQSAIVQFLFPAPAPRSVAGIVNWWEARRLRYNLIVGAAGLFSIAVWTVLSWLPPRWPDDHFIPLGIVVVYGIMANVCYSLGACAEILLQKVWGWKLLPTGPVLFRMGLTFSIGLTLLPVPLAGWDWTVRMTRYVLELL